jgi:lantibiotic modifying enzyme
MRTAWQILLDGNRQEHALGAMDAIVQKLRAATPEALATLPSYSQPGSEATLAGGFAGLAVLFAYLARARSGQDDAASAVRFLEQAMDAVAAAPLPASLYSGFTGVAWATAHLQKDLFEAGDEDPNEAIDEALREHLSQSPWPGQYDLLNGLVGFGVYALEHLPCPAAAAALERVVEALEETARPQAEGITWWTNPKWLPREMRERYPEGYYDLGLAHGVAGIIAFLGRAWAADVARTKTRPLLTDAVRWLLAQQVLDGGEVGFPNWVGPGIRREKTRVGWCYGDLGIAMALLGAARCVGDPAWEREAVAVARRAAERPLDQAGVQDAGLCHGAAGLGHLFNRLYQATGDPLLADAARRWFDKTLEMRHPERGIAGYAAWWAGADGDMTWMDDPALLMGAAGIALALLAASTPIAPAWDRLLLVDVPPAVERTPS